MDHGGLTLTVQEDCGRAGTAKNEEHVQAGRVDKGVTTEDLGALDQDARRRSLSNRSAKKTFRRD